MASTLSKRKCPLDVRFPVLPTETVAPILESAGWDTVEMQHLSRVTSAAHAGVRIATVQTSVGPEVAMHDDAPGVHRIAELIDDRFYDAPYARLRLAVTRCLIQVSTSSSTKPIARTPMAMDLTKSPRAIRA